MSLGSPFRPLVKKGSFSATQNRPQKPSLNQKWSNPTTGSDEIWDGGQWRVLAVQGALTAANNLSDLASASVARSNLGLGTFATQNTASCTSITFADASNLTFNTTTGTKIGTATTQKLAFWNVTPVVQQVLATGAAHTVDEVITLLQTLGLCRQS